MWYKISGIETKFIFTSTKNKIDQLIWLAIPKGNVTITFYANDTVGNLAYKEIIIIKKLPILDNKDLIIFFIFIFIFSSVVAVSATSFHYYQNQLKRKKRQVPLSMEEREQPYQITSVPSAKEIINEITNKKLLSRLFEPTQIIKKKYISQQTNLTTISDDFLRKVDSLGFNAVDKKTFLLEMISLSRLEREEIIQNIISRINISVEHTSKDILNKLSDKESLLQIFDENINLKKKIQLENIKLTIITDKFLNLVDEIGLKGDMKINFIKEMLALSPKEREEIINNILKRKSSNSI